MNLADQILKSVYKEDCIHTQNVEKNDNRTISATYSFKPYSRTIKDLDHVSMAQMNEALVEGLYCLIGHGIEQGSINVGVDLATYIHRMTEALFMREFIKYRKLLVPNELASLKFEIRDVQEAARGKYFSVIANVEGFMRGEVECWLSK